MAAATVWLAGCETTSRTTDSSQPLASATAPDEQPTGSIPTPPDAPPVTPDLLGVDPNDNLSLGKRYYRQGSYGLAERHFRKSVELHPQDAESWLGLAASYDRLKRFDLADRAYAQAISLVGPKVEILNNQGFSYMLRGDYRRARTILLQAQARDPNHPFVKNNLQLLQESARKAKGIN